MDADFKTFSRSTKRKRNKVTKLAAESNTLPVLDDRCPICQFPFIRGSGGNKFTHLDVCKGAREEAEECPAGLNCNTKEHQHFSNFSHYSLALSRCEESIVLKEDISCLNSNINAFDHEKYNKKIRISETVTSENTIYPTNNLALSRCHGESIVIEEDISCLGNNINVFDHEKPNKTIRITETVTSKSTIYPTDNLAFCMTGQIVYNEEVVTSKKMTVSHGAMNMVCEICSKNEISFSNIKPHVKMIFLSECGTTISTMKLHPIELNATFNETGWKKISINYISYFQVKEFELILGNCCHFVDMKCVIGKNNLIQEMNESCPKTLAFFDFNSLCLNECTSPETSILEKIWLNSDQRKKSLENQTALKEISLDSHLCNKQLFDASTCKLTESLQLVQNDTKEKWKNLFKKKDIRDVPVANVNLSFSGRMKGTSRPCPFYKRIPATSFVVDAFQYGIIPDATHYFLTHFHSDHYCGLSKKFKQLIVCSSITAALVMKKLRVDQKHLIVVKHMEASFIKNVKITPLHANHCPGSLMFLFELQNGYSYFHVGDFRADSQMEKYPALNGINVDVLFLDTTYCNPKYEFPTQEAVVEGVIEIARRHTKLQPKTLFVCGTYTIGKEKVFMGLANALQCNVWALKAKLEVLRCFNDTYLNSKLVDDPSKAQVHLWPMGNLNHRDLEQHLSNWKKVFKNIVAFNPSGWNFRERGSKVDNGVTIRNVTIFSIPYSEHSNYNELRRFVKFLKPKKVVPTVSSRGQPYSAISECCNKWLIEPEEEAQPDRQQKLTSFFSKH